jgi:cell division septation protein DedD
MKAIARWSLAVSALLLSSGLAAQTFKCVDALGKITYSGKQCKDLGLKDAGEVKDRLNVQPVPPAYQAPARSRPETGRPSSRTEASEAPSPPPTPTESLEPERDRRCFTVKTAKGNVTRCNDQPPE